jgi:hypothetical protein
MQDSTRDWEIESSLMSKVYGRCYVNLAATHSEDSAGGLFANRDPFKKLYFWIEPTTYIGLPKSQVLPDYLEKDSVLACRAWILQENILAPRTLHFGPEQIIFECSKMIAAEGYPLGFHQTSRTGEEYKTFKQRFYQFHLNAISGSNWNLESFWSDIVKNYSHRKISKDSDVLVALSGIVSQMSALSTSQDQYVAGLWRSDLPRALMWFPKGPVTKTDIYVAPSWSWASLRCEVVFMPRNSYWNKLDVYHAKLDILDVRFTPTNIPFGPVSSASLRVTGLLAEGFTHDKRTSKHDVRFALDQSGSEGYASLSSDESQSLSRRETRKANTMPHGEVYYCLFVQSGVYWNMDFIESLLLAPTGRERGQYRRVGTWTRDGPELPFSQASVLDPSMYEEISGNRVTISII